MLAAVAAVEGEGIGGDRCSSNSSFDRGQAKHGVAWGGKVMAIATGIRGGRENGCGGEFGIQGLGALV